MSSDAHPAARGLNPVDPAVYASHGYPHDLWTRLRKEDPVHRWDETDGMPYCCLLYTSPSPRDQRGSRMPSSA